MPTVKCSELAYKKLVKIAARLQIEKGRLVTVGEALDFTLEKVD